MKPATQAYNEAQQTVSFMTHPKCMPAGVREELHAVIQRLKEEGFGKAEAEGQQAAARTAHPALPRRGLTET